MQTLVIDTSPLATKADLELALNKATTTIIIWMTGALLPKAPSSLLSSNISNSPA
jgi:hypothetical protein